MANICMILGKSGSGKSTSIKGLDPSETVVINILNKRLPFKGSSSLYNVEKKNLYNMENYEDLIALLDKIDSGSRIKNVIIDDSIYIMRKEFFARAKENGYGKFTELAQHFQQLINKCEILKDELNIFFILHSKEVIDDGSIVGYEVQTVGKLLAEQYNPIEVVPMVLYSAIEYDAKGKPNYGFYTHSIMKGKVVIPAKTPDGMFEEDFIPNDLGLVVKSMNEYYN